MPLRPDGEAGPGASFVRRSLSPEAALLGSVTGLGEGSVGEESGAGATPVPNHRPGQGGRFGRKLVLTSSGLFISLKCAGFSFVSQTESLKKDLKSNTFSGFKSIKAHMMLLMAFSLSFYRC